LIPHLDNEDHPDASLANADRRRRRSRFRRALEAVHPVSPDRAPLTWGTITCLVEYVIDPAKIDAFERFARRWIELVGSHGGMHHGYFLLPGPPPRGTG
jgi:hypothetical protein